MGRASAFWAATHPCYDVLRGGYTCACGRRSPNKAAHNRHVVEEHRDDRGFCLMVLSASDYDRLFSQQQA